MDGRSEFIAECVKLYSRKLVAYSTLICGNTELARDAAADSFFRLCALGEIDRERAAAWLYKVCRNRTLDIMRRERPKISIEKIDLPIEDGAEAQGLADRAYMLSLIRALPECQREALMLRFFSGLGYAEIAEVMATTSGNVGSMISRALENLKRKMETDNEIP